MNAALGDFVLWCQSTLLDHVLLALAHPPGSAGPFRQSCFQPIWFPDCMGARELPFQMQDPTFIFVEFHKAPLSPFLQPAKVSLNGSPTFKGLFSVMPLENLMKVHSFPCSLLIKMLNGTGPRLDLLQLPLSIEPNYPVFNLPSSPFIQTVTS